MAMFNSYTLHYQRVAHIYAPSQCKRFRPIKAGSRDFGDFGMVWIY